MTQTFKSAFYSPSSSAARNHSDSRFQNDQSTSHLALLTLSREMEDKTKVLPSLNVNILLTTTLRFHTRYRRPCF